MRRTAILPLGLAGLALLAGWTPLPVADDPLVRMPGTQSGDVALQQPSRCLNCHDDYDDLVDIGGMYQGSMMSQSMRDPLFWAATTVAAQDSIWAVGRPNGSDLCIRCHAPSAWAEGRSEPTNGQSLVTYDFDGIHCVGCHTMVDPLGHEVVDGTRVEDWDETDASGTPSTAAAATAWSFDQLVLSSVEAWRGGSLYDAAGVPWAPTWTEAAGGQFVIDDTHGYRASFADATARHDIVYSRFHKSRAFCATCHDVSNPVLANLGATPATRGDGTTVLPSEELPAHEMPHVERTWSEFALSIYGRGDGAPGRGAFAPTWIDTVSEDDHIASCQDCHMPDIEGEGADKADAVTRPTDSVEHPRSGQPLHTLTGGNAWVPWLLASAVPGSPNHDPYNEVRLRGRAADLTMDLDAGFGVDPLHLLEGAERAKVMLESAARIDDLDYDPATGELSFHVWNDTGHKLISGFPEGRRMFLRITASANGVPLEIVNPYDETVGTLKGLPPAYSPASPPLAAHERHEDALVYEAKMSSSLTGEDITFHFVLADGRHKDNRIPPEGFDLAGASARKVTPVLNGVDRPDLYTTDEYLQGYDDVELTVAPGADSVRVELLYQTTSREYVAFLRDQINGAGTTLSSPTLSGEPQAYVAQTDPFFAALADWGDVIWELWDHNKHVDGARPYLMTEASWTGTPGMTLTVSDAAPGDPMTFAVTGAAPSAPVYIVRGTAEGTSYCPPLLQGQCIGVLQPTILVQRAASASGTLSFSGHVPLSVPAGSQHWFQAWSLDGADVRATPAVGWTAGTP